MVFVSHAIIQGEFGRDLEGILTEEAVGARVTVEVRPGVDDLGKCREAEKKVREIVASEYAPEMIVPKIVRADEVLEIGAAQFADVEAHLQSVPAADPGKIVRNLVLVLAQGFLARPRSAGDARDAFEGDSRYARALRKRSELLEADCLRHQFRAVGELGIRNKGRLPVVPEAQLVQQVGSERVVVTQNKGFRVELLILGDEAKAQGKTLCYFLPAKSSVDGLLRTDVLIDPHGKQVGRYWRR